MLLCDIGNSRAKFFSLGKVWGVEIKELKKYKEFKVCYICVNDEVKKEIKGWRSWINLEPFVQLEGSYEGMGIDRKVLCLTQKRGVLVDAGSAITVDIVRNGVYQGGFIYPGFKAFKKAYSSISPRLDVEVKFSLTSLPKSTQEGVGYGMLAPLVCQINSFKEKVFITGGDGNLLAKFIPHATFNPSLLFEGMLKIVQRNEIC